MARSKKTQNLPDIPWNENEHSRVYKLIAEISAKANYKVLFGKKTSMRFYIGANGPDANNSGEAKNLWGLFFS
ncbi:hypothetical protein BDR04DRAFT_1164494 [Suillus decipiens]|nr:hypothetical protein BDR04DRAFT_1164494 [Suillus decipiens]